MSLSSDGERELQKVIADAVFRCLEKCNGEQQVHGPMITVNRTTDWTTMVRVEQGGGVVHLEVTTRRR